MIRSPVIYKKKMLDAKHEYEVDMERSGWAPSPPIREGAAPVSAPAPAPATQVAPAGPGPASVPAAAPPAAERPDPEEVTRTLATLADLRDRGAISPEEYERKKAELLARI
jgi:hypothetical protein